MPYGASKSVAASCLILGLGLASAHAQSAGGAAGGGAAPAGAGAPSAAPAGSVPGAAPGGAVPGSSTTASPGTTGAAPAGSVPGATTPGTGTAVTNTSGSGVPGSASLSTNSAATQTSNAGASSGLTPAPMGNSASNVQAGAAATNVTSTANAAAANSTAASGAGNAPLTATLPNGVNGAAPVVNGQSASQTVSAVSARDNTQLAGSQTAQNTSRQTTNDTIDANRARIEAQMSNAPSDTANANTRNSPVFGQPGATTDSALNPANQGPVPGGNVATQNGTLGNGPRSTPNVQHYLMVTPTAGYSVVFSPGATTSTPAGGNQPASGARASGAGQGTVNQGGGNPGTINQGGGNTVSQGTGNVASGAAQTPPATRIHAYGPSTTGQSTIRTEQLNGRFQFSDLRKKQARQASR